MSDTLTITAPAWMWLFFMALVASLLVIDLGLFHRKTREIGVKESLMMSGAYLAISLLFAVWISIEMGGEKAIEYVTGFLVEKSLSIDNIFVISMIFSSLGIPRQYQHRVLFWGILGVVIFRACMIGVGAMLVARFSWFLYLFSFFLILAGIKMLLKKRQEREWKSSGLLQWLQKHLRITERIESNAFFIRKPDPRSGRCVIWCTPLFIALVLIECADVVFAVDSVPAIFAITTDVYIVYTSNIFAILGLRSIYFALAASVQYFSYLEKTVGLILAFVGSKIFIADMLGLEKFPPGISLGMTVGLLIGGVLVSLCDRRRRRHPDPNSKK